MLTVLGETLIDLVPDRPGSDRFTARPGGSPLNVAVGLARLGHRTALLARLSDNGFGRRIRAYAEANGVDLAHCAGAAEPATVAVVTVDPDGTAGYDFYLDGTADWNWRTGELTLPAGAGVLHAGSLAGYLDPGGQSVGELMRRCRDSGQVLVTFDPNVRPAVLGDPARVVARTERLAACAHLVKASDEDLRWLYPDRSPGEVAGRLLALGARLVVVTLGAAGALAVTPTATLHRPARPVEVVDTVGAGDAFTAGLLCALVDRGLATPDGISADLNPVLLAEVLDHAARVAALTCARPGADPPRREDLRTVGTPR